MCIWSLTFYHQGLPYLCSLLKLITSSPQEKLFLPPHSLTHSPAWLPLEYPAWLGSIFIRRGRKLSSSAQGEGAEVHWENEFSSSRSKNIPFFFPAELRGLPQPLLKLQVELLLPVRRAQGIGRKAQGFARPVESSESLVTSARGTHSV